MFTSLARLFVNGTQKPTQTYTVKLAAGAALLLCAIPTAIAAANEPLNDRVTAKNSNVPIEVRVATSLLAPKHLQLSFPAPVRVSQVLADTLANLEKVPTDTNLENTNLYWPGAALYNEHDSHEFDEVKSRVVKQLEVLISRNTDTKERNALKSLSNWITTLPTAKRVLSEVDYDAVRINASLNPLLNQNMTLVLPSRPNSIRVMGAVDVSQASQSNTSFTMKWQPRYSAKDYLASLRELDNAENSFAWVIQPDGKNEKHPIAYWNFKHKDIAPGAIVYLPFESLPEEAASLNNDMIKLLRNSAL